MEVVRKKWIVIVNVGLGNLSPDLLIAGLEKVKNAIPKKIFEDFFETEVLIFYVPTRNSASSFEFHEIILDAVGYDKYETIIHNKNMKADKVLNKLKELLNVEE